MKVKLTPYHQVGDTNRAPIEVDLSKVARFGKLDRPCDAREWTMAQLHDGSIWYSLYKDQTADVVKMMHKRLIGVSATGAWRFKSEVLAWEPENRSVSSLTDFPEELRPIAQHRLLRGTMQGDVEAWTIRTKGTRLAYNDKIKKWLKSHGFSYWRCGEWVLPDNPVS